MAPKRPPSTIPMDRLKIRATESLQSLLTLALDEDIGPGDLTTDILIDTGAAGTGELLAKENGVIAGLMFVTPILNRVNTALRFEPAVDDGDRVRAGTILGAIRGPIRSMLTAERTMLNFLQALSGIATLTRRYVDAVISTRTVILDTSLAEWRLFSLLNNRLVSQSVLHRQASQIQYLAIAVSGGSPVHLQSLSLDIQRLGRPD